MKQCSGCDRKLDLEMFAWRNKAKGVRHNRCRDCHSGYSTQWYSDNTERQAASVAANNARYRAMAQAVIIEAKNVPCADCGIKYPPYVMDFDHVRGVKVMDVGLMAGKARSMKMLLAEIDKCEVVCANCHRERTHQRRAVKASVA